LSVGTRRNGTRDFTQSGTPAGLRTEHYAGRHVSTRQKTARWGRRAAVPAVAIAATLAAGAAAYGLTGTGHADPAKLTNAMAAPLSLATVGHDNAAAKKITASRPAAKGAMRAAHRPAASASPSRTAPAATKPAARPAAATAATPAAAASAKPTAAAPASASHAATTGFTCSASSYLLPENVTAIVNFLVGNGYSHNAAAGIAGNIYQESKGDPESEGMGGGGLIGWTPLPSGYVTGNAEADLQTQLNAILTFNQGWASYIPALNAAASPAAAADIYVTDFERAGIPAASTREASAQAVASACGL
jgi:hypothetical protein